jgi:hypothetical protein
VAFDIEHATRIIESSTTAALQRMRQANEKLQRAQRATHDKEARLAEALEEYTRGVAEVVDYLNVASRHHSRANKENGAGLSGYSLGAHFRVPRDGPLYPLGSSTSCLPNR